MTTWTEVVLDNLFPGERIRITNRAGMVAEGWYVGIDACRYAVVFEAPVVPDAPTFSLGANIVYEVEVKTRDIALIERAGCERK